MPSTTPSQAISNVRDRIHATTTTYPDTVGIKHYNWSYEDVTSDIQLLDEEYYFTYSDTDTVLWQDEYLVTQVNVWTDLSPVYRDINRVKNVLVKYTSTQEYFTKLKQVSPDYLKYGKDWHKDNQVEPVYFIQDNSIWIYPATTEAVTWWMRIEVETHPWELTISDIVIEVFVPKRISRIIEEWMMQYAYEYIGKEDRVPQAIQLYDKRKKEALEQIKKRDSWVYQSTNAIQHNLR